MSNKTIDKEMNKYFNIINKLEKNRNKKSKAKESLKKIRSDINFFKKHNITSKRELKKMTNTKEGIKKNIEHLDDQKRHMENVIYNNQNPNNNIEKSFIEGINKINMLNTKVENNFPDNELFYKVSKTYYDNTHKKVPEEYKIDQRQYLKTKKEKENKKDIKKFKKLENKGLTFGGKTKHNRKNSKRTTRKV